MNVLGIIPARCGSKRIKHKNTRLLGDKTLVEWAMSAASGARLLTQFIVSSDSDDVLAVAGSYGIRRPADLCTDTSPAIEYVRHGLRTVEDETGITFDAVAIIQPTSPLTLPEDIDGSIELLESSGADSVVTVRKVSHAFHPDKFKRMNGDRLEPYYRDEIGMAAHEMRPAYVRNCSVYVSRVSVFAGGNVIGGDCRGYVMPAGRSIDINEPADLAMAEMLLMSGRGRYCEPLLEGGI